ncbi:MAG: hypothetical protein ABJP70_10525 [Erythrobacter sp.]
MTKDDIDTDASPGAKQALIFAATFIAAVFLIGLVFGFSQSILKHGEIEAIDIAILAGMLTALAVVLNLVWRVWPRARPDSEAQSTIKSRTILLQMAVIGLVLGVISALADPDSSQTLFSNGPLTPVWAGAMLAIWLVFLPVISWKWWQSVDEHEATAYREGGFWAAHLYLFLVPAWWIAERAGWLPPQEPMIVFIIVCVFWTGWWLYKRYF